MSTARIGWIVGAALWAAIGCNGKGGNENLDGGDVPSDRCDDGGVASRCVPECTPRKCSDVGATCGLIGDGCGSTLYCGDCDAPDTCGGGGVPSECGSPKCEPMTCESFGATCGWVGDGCGGKVFCGNCTTAGETCGGGGDPFTCGKPSDAKPCTPRSCTDLGLGCGPAGDGCGNLIDCGNCIFVGGTDDFHPSCGGGGQAGVCGAPSCTPLTVPEACAARWNNCGPVADGCGGVLDCGTCATGSTCGGDGMPNVCSVPRSAL